MHLTGEAPFSSVLVQNRKEPVYGIALKLTLQRLHQVVACVAVGAQIILANQAPLCAALSAFQGSILVLDLIVPATQVARWQATLVLVEEKAVVTRKAGVIRTDCTIGYTAPEA